MALTFRFTLVCQYAAEPPYTAFRFLTMGGAKSYIEDHPEEFQANNPLLYDRMTGKIYQSYTHESVDAALAEAKTGVPTTRDPDADKVIWTEILPEHYGLFTDEWRSQAGI